MGQLDWLVGNWNRFYTWDLIKREVALHRDDPPMQLQPQIDCFWQKPIEPSPSSWNRHRICKLLLLHLLWTAGICYTQSIQCVDAHHVDWFYMSLPNFTTSNFPIKVQDCLVVPQWMNTTHNNDYVPKRQRSTVTLTLVYFSGNLPSVLSCVCLFFSTHRFLPKYHWFWILYCTIFETRHTTDLGQIQPVLGE